MLCLTLFYLELSILLFSISYTQTNCITAFPCFPVVGLERPQCTSRHEINVDSPSFGYLASNDARLATAGPSRCTWILTAKPGQYFRLSMYNFALFDDRFQPHTSCLKLADFYEDEKKLARQLTICDVRGRFDEVWRSQGNVISVQINTAALRLVGEFVIKYEGKLNFFALHCTTFSANVLVGFQIATGNK